MSSQLSGALIALLVPVCFGSGMVLARVGLVHVPSGAGNFLSLVVGWTLVASVTAILHPDALFGVSLGAFGWLAMIGVVNFPIGRFMNFASIKHLGVLKANPILAMAPIVSAFEGVVFLGERINWAIGAGTLLAVSGVIIVVYGEVTARGGPASRAPRPAAANAASGAPRPSTAGAAPDGPASDALRPATAGAAPGGPASDAPRSATAGAAPGAPRHATAGATPGGKRPGLIERRPRLIGYLAAAGAAVAYGTVPLLGRIAVTGEADGVPLIGRFASDAATLPLVSATYTMLIGFIVMGLFAAPSIPGALRAPRRALLFVALGGLAMSTGVSLLYLALSRAPVVVVSPVFALNAFVALVLAHFFLQRLERITPLLVLGTVFVVAGVVAVIIGAEA